MCCCFAWDEAAAFALTPHADFEVATRNVLLFQSATATANYRPPPPSQSLIFVPAVPIVVGRQVYNYHVIYESMLEGMEAKAEAEAIGPLWVEVLTSLQQVGWWRAVDLRNSNGWPSCDIPGETDATTSA
ncbi:hypothetical protein M422DRAFT_254860 [Sphaerobolus stellatus SS14]|uniref:Uncharacterized protein n=1 Tax=Sphaerobolus stellatus (strain SS14) TaxID=990650 RepID=A0A0C9UGH6_SPHS4|nr:hypothetical protein M422DRAFT_254860 [Sphaerobolus stellatus SS14]